MIKLLIGGSPCTFWSIAQKNGREVTAEGLGWELFKNYLIAKEKFKPDFFLYENNKSAAQPIKDQIARELGVDLMYINSALVSAQNRQRFYAFNWTVDQPEDRGIYLKDILETGLAFGDKEGKTYCLTSNYSKGSTVFQTLEHHKRTLAAEPITLSETPAGLCATPVRVGDMPTKSGKITGSQNARIYDSGGKSVTLTARPNGGGVDGPLYAIPAADPLTVNETVDGKARCIRATSYKDGVRNLVGNETDRRTCVAYPVQVETAQGIAWRGRGDGSAFEIRNDGKANALTAAGHQSRMVAQTPDGKTQPVYEVINGEIEIKGKKYPIKLPDGYYIIRKLTPVECERLQTLPDNYTAAVSNTQRYKGLGNGWTAEVIIHILTGALKDVPRDEEIVVLSMYDGIGTGRYCLEKMGFTNVTYYAYEIDGPAMKVALSNYPDIIQCGDAFDLRRDDWELGKRFSKDQPTEKSTEAARDGDATDPADAPSDANLPTREECDETESREEAPRQRNEFDDDVIDILLELRDERYQLSQINSKNRRYSFEVRALEYAVSILEVVT